jgi:hypothetical protein
MAVKSHEDWMRKTPLTQSNQKEMLEKFIACRSSRRQVIESDDQKVNGTYILNRYPRLMDLYEAVSDISIWVSWNFSNHSMFWMHTTG